MFNLFAQYGPKVQDFCLLRRCVYSTDSYLSLSKHLAKSQKDREREPWASCTLGGNLIEQTSNPTAASYVEKPVDVKHDTQSDSDFRIEDDRCST